ncbi:hyalin-like [Amphiura filiformis]|uniref:hyalin-like n=1 Tax=Amphiura filiformis TaxID=82378 RepID=UPI003B21A958
MTRSHQPGAQFPIGRTSVRYEFTDTSGNSATCVFTVEVRDTSPPVIHGCPSNIETNVELGETGTYVYWVEPSASDNYELVSTQRSHSPLQNRFEVGVTTVTYTFIDTFGNTASCEFSITVATEDSVPPEITRCPSNIKRTIELGPPVATVTWEEPSTTDLSGLPEMTRSHQPGTGFPIGLTSVMYMFTDSSNNAVSCSFSITITAVDTTPPTLHCPDIVRDIELGTSSIPVYWIPPIATDLSGDVSLVERSHSPGQEFGPGQTNVSYTFEDRSGNRASCIFSVTLDEVDTTPPTLHCPDIVRDIELGTSSIPVYWIPPKATDLSGIVSLVERSHSPGQEFGPGQTNVSYTFEDRSGNRASCIFSVTIDEVDTTPPTLHCPDILREIELGISSIPVYWIPPIATDVSGDVSLVEHSHSRGQRFGAGQTNVSYTFEDRSGNRASCIFSVTIDEVDTTPPGILNCPSQIQEPTDKCSFHKVITWERVIAVDFSGTVNLLYSSHTSGQEFPIGETAVSLAFVDNSTNVAFCNFSIIIEDVDTCPPTILNCPADMSVTTEMSSVKTTLTWTEPTATDASTNVTLLSKTHSPGDTFYVGSTAVLYFFADSSNNSAVCNFSVSVEKGEVDTRPPTILNCPADMSVTTEMSSVKTTVTWTEPTATDVTLLTKTHSPGDTFYVGSTTVLYVFVDSSDKVVFCSLSVSVAKGDNTPPTIEYCPESIMTDIELGTNSTTVSWSTPNATDVSGNVSLVSQNYFPGHEFTVGSYNVTYNFTDGSGNGASCDFTVIIREVDTQPPTILNCPADISVTTEMSSVKTTLTWTEPTATDASNNVTLLSKTHSPGDSFYVGSTAVLYFFADSSNNSAVCNFSVSVEKHEVDTRPPTILNCPADMSVTTEMSSVKTTLTWTEPTATDDSNEVTLLTKTHSPGDTFYVGSTTVLYFFVDSSNNFVFCSFLVSVEKGEGDNTPPAIEYCPESIMTDIELGTNSTTVSWGTPNATDVSGNVSLVSQNYFPGHEFTVGSYNVTYNFTDDSGNGASCDFTVTIREVDTRPPTILNCPADISATTKLSSVKTTLTWTEPTAIDASNNVTLLSKTHSPGDTFYVGSTLVLYCFVDSSDNFAFCNFSVLVEKHEVDTRPPTILNCPADMTVTTEMPSVKTTLTWTEPTATDDSNEVTLLKKTHSPGDSFYIGSTTVLYFFVDSSNNYAVCDFTVLVETPDG